MTALGDSGVSTKGSGEPQPSDVIPDDLILAALSRVECHRGRKGAPIWSVQEQLALRKGTKKARQVRAQLVALTEAGAVEQSHQHKVPIWVLTAKGKRRLSRVRQVADLLPESPQHRKWREARALSEQKIESFSERLRSTLEEAMLALDGPPVRSDVWFVLSRQLAMEAWRVGSATHCLREWVEPAEDRPDDDDLSEPSDEKLSTYQDDMRKARRAGRRHVLNWRDDEDDV